jgi:tryptophan synthase beta subunit
VLFDFGAAGVGELEHAADLVEGFAGGVIDGAADELVLSVCLHIDEHGMAAGNDEAEVGWDCSFFEER